jgi:hypothetical protein
MRKLLILLLLPVFTQANFTEELYESMKDDLTHIECKATGERYARLGTATDKKQLRKTDYFSFQDNDNFPYLFMKLQDIGYLNTLVLLPAIKEGERFEYGNDSYKVISFNDESLVFYFEANRDQLRGMYKDGEEYRQLTMEWTINRISGAYSTRVEKAIYIAKFTEIQTVSEKLQGSCERHDPNKKKF